MLTILDKINEIKDSLEGYQDYNLNPVQLSTSIIERIKIHKTNRIAKKNFFIYKTLPNGLDKKNYYLYVYLFKLKPSTNWIQVYLTKKDLRANLNHKYFIKNDHDSLVYSTELSNFDILCQGGSLEYNLRLKQIRDNFLHYISLHISPNFCGDLKFKTLL